MSVLTVTSPTLKKSWFKVDEPQSKNATDEDELWVKRKRHEDKENSQNVCNSVQNISIELSKDIFCIKQKTHDEELSGRIQFECNSSTSSEEDEKKEDAQNNVDENQIVNSEPNEEFQIKEKTTDDTEPSIGDFDGLSLQGTRGSSDNDISEYDLDFLVNSTTIFSVSESRPTVRDKNLKEERYYVLEDPEHEVMQFLISPLDEEQKMWRVIQIRCFSTFRQLHKAFQMALGWKSGWSEEDQHRHHFVVNNPETGNDDVIRMMEEYLFYEGTEHEEETMINKYFTVPEQNGVYIYNGWLHDFEYQGRFPLVEGEIYPKCVKGEEVCPPENSEMMSANETYVCVKNNSF